jgi:hypothetical protein
MVKDFIQYTEALELKQLGFDETCFGWFRNTEFTISFNDLYPKERGEEIKIIAAPTYSQAFRWFREKYKLHPLVQFGKLKEWDDDVDVVLYDFSINEQWTVGKYWLDYSYGFKHHCFEYNFQSYEEAELACLKKLIEIIKNK